MKPENTSENQTHAASEALSDENVQHDVQPATTPRRTSFPSWYDFVVLAVLFAVSMLIQGFVTMKCGYPADIVRSTAAADIHGVTDTAMSSAARATALGYIAGMGAMILMTLVYRRLRGGAGSEGRIARFSPRGFDPALLLEGFVVILAAGTLFEPLVKILPGTPDYNMLGRGGWVLLSTVICAPLFEEFLFRGMILEAVRRRRGVIAAWLISSLCFGLAHGLPSQMVATGVIGLVLGDVYLRSGSLFSGILLHALNNALAMLLLILGYGDLSISDLVGPKTYFVIYAASGVVFVWWALAAVRRIVVMQRAKRQSGDIN